MRWALAVALAACGAPDDGGAQAPAVDVDRVLAHVDALATTPRLQDTADSGRAADYITTQLASFDVTVERFAVGTVEIPAIDMLGTTWRHARSATSHDPDLVVRFGPARRALLVMAHYDTVEPSPGAVDNAAAVGVLIELARALHDHPPAQPVILAFTASEEIGLVGATALAERRGDEVAFAIALDMIGGSGELSLNGASELIGRAEMAWLADAANRAGVRIEAPLPHRVVSRWWPQAERSDHGPFTLRGIRAIHLYDRGQDGEWIDLAYHSERDVPARVHRASVDRLARVLCALVDTAPPEHDRDGFWLPLATNRVIPRWTLVAFELVLVVVALLALVPRRRDTARGAGLIAAIGCYAFVVTLLVVVEKWAAGDHPAPWLHAPLRAELAEMLILAPGLYVVTRLLARRFPWVGAHRYLACAVVVELVFGVGWLTAGAAELAWIWLVPAAMLALAPSLRFSALGALLAIASTLLPPALVLAPAQLREAAWNGFLPLGLPLSAWLSLLLAPTFATIAWWARRHEPGVLGSLVLSVGCTLAVISGVALLTTGHPLCTSSEFRDFQLACEQAKTWPTKLHYRSLTTNQSGS